jgi:outer membrane protein OmpA-like peptidoglycan-associated protein
LKKETNNLTMKMKLSLQKRGLAIMMAALTLMFTFTASSCNVSRAAKGGAIGAGVGGAIGGVIGHKAGNTVVGVLVGAAVGGAAGALIGRHMDKQAAELKNDLKGATVQRVGEGILITFSDGLQFDVNSSDLRSNSRANLEELARVINKYDDTNILIEGHTDITGSLSYNQTLSERRAESVRRHLISQGVVATRLASVGYGPSQPLADNETVEGRQINRRVEVAIYANEKMKRAAERGQL